MPKFDPIASPVARNDDKFLSLRGEYIGIRRGNPGITGIRVMRNNLNYLTWIASLTARNDDNKL